MDNSKIYDEAERVINKIIQLLNIQYETVKKANYGLQNIADLRQGLVKKDGLYIPYKSVEHKFLFDGYETIFLEVFIELYTGLFQNEDATFAQFALRTLAEMGIYRAKILYDRNITQDDKNKYKLLLWLADYASISSNIENKRTYEKLLNEYEYLLTAKEKEFYRNLLSNLGKLSPIETYSLIKQARRRINLLQESLYRKTDLLPFFREINIIALFSSFSHILHGNVLLLKDILQLKRPNAQKMRVYWFLLLAGVNTINCVAEYVSNSEINNLVEEINEEFIRLQVAVNRNWQSL